MNIMGYISLVIIGLAAIYLFYQLARNNKVFRIRSKWIKNSDNRWYKYEYEFMFTPGKLNWYGLKFPLDSDFT